LGTRPRVRRRAAGAGLPALIRGRWAAPQAHPTRLTIPGWSVPVKPPSTGTEQLRAGRAAGSIRRACGSYFTGGLLRAVASCHKCSDAAGSVRVFVATCRGGL